MNKYYKVLIIILGSLNLQLLAQPVIEWEKNLGGSERDQSIDIIQTNDEGYLVIGNVESGDIDVGGNNGELDGWIVKLNNGGEIIWERNFGGVSDDLFSSVLELVNGDIMILGTTFENGFREIWLTKLDENGNLIWDKLFGGSLRDFGFHIEETNDGGFIIGGETSSNDGDVGGNNGEYDVWIVKINALGDIVWEQNYGGNLFDHFGSMQELSDGGFIVAGRTGETTDQFLPGVDSWLMRLDSNGEILWEKIFEASDADVLYSVHATNDNAFVACGFSKSNDGDIGENNGGNDLWVVKVDITGNIVWSQIFGGSDHDYGTSIFETADGKYIIGGYTGSNDGDISENNGLIDCWLLKLDNDGSLIWEQNFGGTSVERGRAVKQTIDNGLIFTGSSASIDGDASDNNGVFDFWVVKFSPLLTGLKSSSNELKFDLFPNPSDGDFTISLTTDGGEVSLEIYNILGNQVYAAKNSTNKFEVQNLDKGIYLLYVFKEGQFTTRKLIVN